jgi:hypothetical protein
MLGISVKKQVCMNFVGLAAGAFFALGQAKQPSLGMPQSKVGTAAAPGAAASSKAAPSKTAPKQEAPVGDQKLTPQEIARLLAQAHQEWAVGSDSPLASVSLKEVARTGALYTYNLYASGMSRNKLYNVIAWPVNQPRAVEVVKGIALDAVGLAICPGQLGTCGDITKPNQPVNLSITVAPGRPVRVGLISQDEAERAFMKNIPLPIRGVDKTCKIEAVTLTQNASMVLIEGSGFPPNADINLRLLNTSDPTPTEGKAKAEADGSYSMTVLPLGQGQAFGTEKIEVKSPTCNPSLSFEWGVKPAPAAAAPAANPPAAAPVK